MLPIDERQKNNTEHALPGGNLYPYQMEAVQYIYQHRGRAMIADGVGLGKTVEAIAWLYYQPHLRPALIVCPVSVKLQWQRQTIKWLGLSSTDITAIKGTKTAPVAGDIVICNYDILAKRLPDILDWQPRCVIFDESQYIKESSSARSKAARTLAHSPSVISVLGLTGTPVLNRPRECWHQVLAINPSIWPNWWKFAMRYCNPHRHTFLVRGGGGASNQVWDFSGASNLDDLSNLLKQKVMIRRLKNEVRQDLPPCQTVTLPFTCNIKEYRRVQVVVQERLKSLKNELYRERQTIQHLPPMIRDKAIAHRAEEKSVTKLHGYMIQEIEKLKQEAARCMIAPVVEWVTTFLDSETPLVLFVHHHEIGDAIAKAIAPVLPPGQKIPPPVDARMSQKHRQEIVDQFAGGQYPLIICGIKTMGSGVDGLQRRASHLAFMELGWSPEDHNQAIGRLYRDGQSNPVTAYYLMATDTINEQIAQLLDAKASVTAATVGELDNPGVLESIVDMVLEELN